jgi:hypothetical protein
MKDTCSKCGSRWCGDRYEQLRGRSQGHRPPLPCKGVPFVEYCMSLLKRSLPSDNGAGGSPAGNVVGVGDSWPAAAEFLTMTRWEDGKRRETGTIMIVCEGGMWKAWLHDRDAHRSAWLSGSTAAEMMEAVEQALLSGCVGWRPDRGAK